MDYLFETPQRPVRDLALQKTLTKQPSQKSTRITARTIIHFKPSRVLMAPPSFEAQEGLQPFCRSDVIVPLLMKKHTSYSSSSRIQILETRRKRYRKRVRNVATL